MYRINSTYGLEYFPQFQASTRVLRMYLPTYRVITVHVYSFSMANFRVKFIVFILFIVVPHY